MPIRIVVAGRPLPTDADTNVAASRGDLTASVRRTDAERYSAPPPASRLLDNLRILAAFQSPTVDRGAEKAPVPQRELELQDDDIVEWELEGGFRLWTSAAAYHDELKRDRPELVKDGVVQWAPPRRLGPEQRGLAEWSARSFRFLRLASDELMEQAKSPKDWPRELSDLFSQEVTNDLAKLGAWATIKALIWLIERQLTPGPGLYRWPTGAGGLNARFQDAKPLSSGNIPSDRSILVCLHGTASSTVGSFGYLNTADPKTGLSRQAEWQKLTQRFGSHIYAWEHRTLGESPIENAVALAERLPDRARLNLLSHSRGGLIGDLISMPSIPEAWRKAYSHGLGLEQMDAFDVSQLTKLDGLLKTKRFQIEQFARVACPARGTLLASENIERFLSLLLYLIGLVPSLAASTAYTVLKRIVLEVAKNRTNAKWIPGIAAMVPDSPLIRMLNIAREKSMLSPASDHVLANGNLGVIAGDWASHQAGILQKLLVPISDLFVFGSNDNDWVVNTESMFLGAPRKHDSYYIFDRGGDVSHFKYFENARTRAKVADWLVLPPESESPSPSSSLSPADGSARVPTGFQKIAEFTRPQSIARGSFFTDDKESRDLKPLLFVVPDVFGSDLAEVSPNNADPPFWLDLESLSLDGFEKLSLQEKSRNQITTRLADFYSNWHNQLDAHYKVVQFAYDWRRSIDESAGQLRDLVSRTLRARRGDKDKFPKKKIRFLAHGAGALVVRRLFSDNFPLSETSRALPELLSGDGGVRVVMLGAPHHGSAAVAAMLTGGDATLRRLALLNPRYPLDRVLDLFASFPGLLELLPEEPRWFSSSTWHGLRKANQDVGALPQEAALRDAKRMIETRAKAGTGTAAQFVSVLGCGVGTAIDLRVEDNRLAIENTDRGDGRVAHESSILADSDVYFADGDHSELATSSELLPAYLELLEHGATSRLPRTPYPSTEKALQRSPSSPVHFPTRGELVDDLFGKKRVTKRRVTARHVTLSVLHGDLRFAKYPVMVGHYEGDTIGGVERYLDKKLRGVLVDRYRLGNYPGPLETSQTVVPHIDRHEKHVDLPAGALVIGLGRMGQLSCGELTRAVRHGLIDYAMEMSSRHDFDKLAEGRQQGEELGVSLLIIGSETAAMMTIEDCVASMLRGVAQANLELQRSRRRTRISNVEIVNLFLDTAIAALNAAVVAAPTIGIESGTEFVFEDQPPRLVQHRSGRLRIDPLPTSHTWRRWEITALPPPETRETVRQLPESLHDILREGLRHAPLKNTDARDALFEMAFPGAKVDDAVPLGLRFVAMADRARAEKTVEGRQRPVIDNLIRRSIDDGVFRPQIAKALGQLLIPNDLKDGLANLDNLVLVLDGETAMIPWELLVLDDSPLATRIGLIRQLIATNYRSATRLSHARTAFVVGNPATQDDVPSLDGAQCEAREVAGLLEDHGFSVEDRYTERAEAHDVFVGLLQNSYQVLHLAGHGYFSRHKADKPVRYGMLLNGNQYLTAQEIQQLPQVPELVFLNCCHLAGMEEETRSERQFEYSKLAASLAEELIKMGVRAIVAAGWAVRDDLAKEFATTFYHSMLDGEPFGHAVKDARKAIWQSASDSNTWAAYQAYGDPDYRLRFRSLGIVDSGVVTGGDRGRVGGGRSAAGEVRRTTISRSALVTPRQLVEQLRQIAFAGQLDDVESLRNLGVATDSPEKMLDELVAACPSDWLKRVDVLSALGRAHAELGRYPGAVDHYRRAIQAPSSDDGHDVGGQLTLQSIEQLADCETRLGLRSLEPQLVIEAIKRLDLLCQLHETPERLSLRGAAYTARAALDKRGDIRDWLAKAHNDYEAAAELETRNAERENRPPRTSQYHSAAVALRIACGEEPRGEANKWLRIKMADSSPTNKLGEVPPADANAIPVDYAEIIAPVDRQLYVALKSRRRSEDVTKFATTIAAAYKERWELANATPRPIRATIAWLDLLGNLFEIFNKKDLRVGELRALVDKLSRFKGVDGGTAD